MQAFGARISNRKLGSGELQPYEINVALWDALRGTLTGGQDKWQMARFLSAHRIMLSLEGIPALYIHSLIGTRNDYHRLQHTGHNRAINRHIWKEEALHAALADSKQHHGEVFGTLHSLLLLRQKQPAFHPNATQFTLHLGTSVFAYWRQSINRDQSIFCLNNITDCEQHINLADINLIGTERWWDLLSDSEVSALDTRLELAPYQSVWLSNVNLRQLEDRVKET